MQSIAAVHAVMLERCAYNAFDVGEPVEKLRSWVEVSQPPVMISSKAALRRLNITDTAATLGEFPRMVLDVDHALQKASSTALPLRPAHAPEDSDRPVGVPRRGWPKRVECSPAGWPTSSSPAAPRASPRR